MIQPNSLRLSCTPLAFCFPSLHVHLTDPSAVSQQCDILLRVFQIWEGVVTLCLFPITVFTAYVADRKFLSKNVSKMYRASRHRGIVIETEGATDLEMAALHPHTAVSYVTTSTGNHSVLVSSLMVTSANVLMMLSRVQSWWYLIIFRYGSILPYALWLVIPLKPVLR